ncbi:hypothetical protein MGG_14648 [Pyricularia oryzae 70-15]|uniref:Uncharacterized protein n=1 Tax=Pyricularia oryzae (strain 70-15 / ATCC MYA-4617 / FGSC 8958) TaxID=242507 RepID=G4NDH2_PYRO7|nr:uncharacterized protein MGG_14648 [Pyricularia oryzae 70-15]EHA48461.1 hypothetical protein MGG_14648 [Pyricularia oryzae 70-15]
MPQLPTQKSPTTTHFNCIWFSPKVLEHMLPWPWEFQHDDKTSSWLNPAKLDLFKTHGTLEGNIYDGCGEGAYCFVEDKTVHGDSYWVNYTVGKVGGPGRPEEAPAPGA